MKGSYKLHYVFSNNFDIIMILYFLKVILFGNIAFVNLY